MQQINGIKETCLYIKDLQQAYDFYHDLLEFSIIHYEEDKHLFLRVGKDVLLCFNPEDSKTKSSPPPHFADGNQHIAFGVSQESYREIKEIVASKGIEIIDKVIWKSGQESFYFLDPEKNVLEIVPDGVWD